MSDDEPDYMSDAFLAQCLPVDVRPGLKRTHASQREHEVSKKRSSLQDEDQERKQSKNSKKFLESEKREEGLNTCLNSSNKGFAMLSKMGYKVGDSLGKDNTGRVEPIPIEVKCNRFGLGREAAVEKVVEAKKRFRLKHAEERSRHLNQRSEMTAKEFREQLSRNRKSKRIESDLYKSMKACHQLDLAKGYEEPVEIWFWPDGTLQEVAEDSGEVIANENKVEECQVPENDADEDLVEEAYLPEEKLEMITNYLRSQYLYCLWCGNSFSDTEDLLHSCPGPTREDHDE